MTSDLERLTALRPPADPPDETVRRRALQALLAAIDDEPPGIHAGRHRSGASSVRRRTRIRPPRHLSVAVAVVAALVVMVGAIVLLGRSGSSSAPGAARPGHGQILAAGGRPGVLISPLRKGLDSEYGSWLRAGDDLQTSLNPGLERTALGSLSRSLRRTGGTEGAVVAMNPQTGAVVALGSMVSGRRQRDLRPIDGATQSVGPVGSALAPITATAALQSGDWTPTETFDDTGRYCTGVGGDRQCRTNAGDAAYGELDVARALTVEDTDFFDNLGVVTNVDPHTHPDGGVLQAWARNLGLGRRTGVDLPAENRGLLPNPSVTALRNRLEHECDKAIGPYHGGRTHPPGGCGIADGTNRPYSVGDNENLAVGQGDVQVSPLQLADAYATIANGHAVVVPHVGARLIGRHGQTVRTIDPAPAWQVPLSPSGLAAVRRGMLDNTSAPDGVSDDVFGRFQTAVYGAVGTARYISPADDREQDDAWFAGYVNATAHHGPLVVVVWVVHGGFGDVAAAPVARQILSRWETGRPGPYVAGSSTAQ